MQEADLARVLEIERLSFPVPWSEDHFRFEMGQRDTRSRLRVLLVDGAVQGFIVYWIIEDSGEILDLAVAPRMRSRGYASRLVRAALNEMDEQDVRDVHLEIRSSNRAAEALYAKYGFEKAYRRKDYYERPVEDAWVLRVSLDR